MQSEEFDVVNNDSRIPTDQSNTEEQDEFVKNKIEFINRYKKSSNWGFTYEKVARWS